MAGLLDKISNRDIINDEMIASDLLVSAKAAVRSYAVAITETASPEIHELLKKQLDEAIALHHKVATYMIENEMYHAYNVTEQLANDLKKAEIAEKTPVKG
ncbi:spore coat protein [Jeotgalibacillus proteolyticus]|uniref:Spore coat protein n=1 Tax=Jeotgalibacillus proteolyticus TaxID=2082395 RepID=A0A2S5GBK8_9BACL|nr:spore coat protein [Jeotgalibacillus proteolyticus]PPA70386.1 spore coat protein [Jeotgalibacillus proteolyticus]